jgi:hypothetical protein
MIVTIHQPEHFPYEGFFQKIKSADLFVVLDNVKYKKNDYQNRNRLINTQGELEWFGVSVPKKSTSKKICDVVVLDEKLNNWRNKTIKKIEYNVKPSKKKLDEIIEIYSYNKLIDINLASIIWCMNYLKIKTPIINASSLFPAGSKSELLLDICKKTNVSKYLSGPFGTNYLDIPLFKENNIDVEFFSPQVKNYHSMLCNIIKGE